MSRTRFVFTTLLFFATNIIVGQLFSDNYYFYKPDLGKSNNKWIILLPGSSGLKIFDSTFGKSVENKFQYEFSLDTLRLYDQSRQREIPIAIFKPSSKVSGKQKVIIFSHGY